MTTGQAFFFEQGISLYSLFGLHTRLANYWFISAWLFTSSILLEQLKWYRKVMAVELKLGVSWELFKILGSLCQTGLGHMQANNHALNKISNLQVISFGNLFFFCFQKHKMKEPVPLSINHLKLLRGDNAGQGPGKMKSNRAGISGLTNFLHAASPHKQLPSGSDTYRKLTTSKT